MNNKGKRTRTMEKIKEIRPVSVKHYSSIRRRFSAVQPMPLSSSFNPEISSSRRIKEKKLSRPSSANPRDRKNPRFQNRQRNLSNLPSFDKEKIEIRKKKPRPKFWDGVNEDKDDLSREEERNVYKRKLAGWYSAYQDVLKEKNEIFSELEVYKEEYTDLKMQKTKIRKQYKSLVNQKNMQKEELNIKIRSLEREVDLMKDQMDISKNEEQIYRDKLEIAKQELKLIKKREDIQELPMTPLEAEVDMEGIDVFNEDHLVQELEGEKERVKQLEDKARFFQDQSKQLQLMLKVEQTKNKEPARNLPKHETKPLPPRKPLPSRKNEEFWKKEIRKIRRKHETELRKRSMKVDEYKARVLGYKKRVDEMTLRTRETKKTEEFREVLEKEISDLKKRYGKLAKEDAEKSIEIASLLDKYKSEKTQVKEMRDRCAEIEMKYEHLKKKSESDVEKLKKRITSSNPTLNPVPKPPSLHEMTTKIFKTRREKANNVDLVFMVSLFGSRLLRMLKHALPGLLEEFVTKGVSCRIGFVGILRQQEHVVYKLQDPRRYEILLDQIPLSGISYSSSDEEEKCDVFGALEMVNGMNWSLSHQTRVLVMLNDVGCVDTYISPQRLRRSYNEKRLCDLMEGEEEDTLESKDIYHRLISQTVCQIVEGLKFKRIQMWVLKVKRGGRYRTEDLINDLERFYDDDELKLKVMNMKRSWDVRTILKIMVVESIKNQVKYNNVKTRELVKNAMLLRKKKQKEEELEEREGEM